MWFGQGNLLLRQIEVHLRSKPALLLRRLLHGQPRAQAFEDRRAGPKLRSLMGNPLREDS